MNGAAVEFIAPSESCREAAKRFSAGKIRDEYRPEGLHRWRNADGTVRFFRMRLKHPESGNKWLRPFHLNAEGTYVMGEPKAPETGKLLYNLPTLIAADSGKPVFIGEGESCADALANLGLVSTTSGGATSATAADWSPLRDRRCVIWRDNDQSGTEYAEAVIAKLRGVADVRLIDTSVVESLPKHGDVVDWLEAHPNATATDILALPTEAPTSCGENSKIAGIAEPPQHSAPEPLRRPVPASEPYPIDELGPILSPACKSLQRVIQSPDAVCGASLLAAASLAAQGHADVSIDGRTYPLSLFMLTVAESGERKSAVDSEAMRAEREHEKILTRNYTEECAAHDAQMAEWDAMRDTAKSGTRKASGGQGLASSLEGIGPAPQPPLLPTLVAENFTAEGLAKMLAGGQPSIGVFTDESALVFGGHGMNKESIARTAATLCKLWDRGTLDRVRGGDGVVKIYGRRLAMHLMAQPIIAERALSDDVLAGQGFLARCLLAWPESTAGHRLYVPESLKDDPAMLLFTSTLSALHGKSLPLADDQRNELAPPALRLTPKAFVVWRNVHDTIESAIAPGGRFATVKPWASKTPEQCLRIAGVLTLVENPEARNIEAPTIERATEIALWHLNEAVRLAGTAELSPEVRNAEALLNWCHATGRQQLHSCAALQYGPARIRERPRFIEAMRQLEHAGWATKVEGGAGIDGAHRLNVWMIEPETS